MGLFSFGKKGSAGIGNPQVNWLRQVDEAYNRAFQTKNATGLENYFTRACLVKTMEKIRLGEKAFSGLSRYQKVTWVKKAESPERTIWLKKIEYDQIKMSHGVVVPVGDNTNEEWVVINENGVGKVAEIRRVC